jgi:opacity protein-like surface antigen
MRKLGIAAALASTVLATPAVARDNTFYVGADIGPMVVQDSKVHLEDTNGDRFQLDHKMGFDGDLLAGYDFGFLRAEAEISYKHASVSKITTNLTQIEADGHSSAFAGMINGLVDFGNEEPGGLYGFAGGGIGYASVHHSASADLVPPFATFDISDSDSHMAWQLIAGARWVVSPNIDVGFKYRYFSAGHLRMGCDCGTNAFDVRTQYHSHSLLLSLAYNFAAPPPPPPPPAPERGL